MLLNKLTSDVVKPLRRGEEVQPTDGKWMKTTSRWIIQGLMTLVVLGVFCLASAPCRIRGCQNAAGRGSRPIAQWCISLYFLLCKADVIL
jgi:hypothetical protein